MKPLISLLLILLIFHISYAATVEIIIEYENITENIPENCTENWQCTEWSECINNIQTRTCIDINNCNTTFNKPPESGSCEQTILPSYSSSSSGFFQLPPSSKINKTQFSVLVSDFVMQTYVNQSIQSSIIVKNIGESDLNNLKILIYELPKEWLFISPSFTSKLKPNTSTSFLITYTPLTNGSYKFRINVTSDETSLSFDSLLLVIELKPEEKKEIEEKREEVKKEVEKKAFFEIYSTYFIIFGFIAPVIIAVYMIFFLLSKRCPLCGGKMKLDYRGEHFLTYRCSQCLHWEIKEKK